MAYGRGCHVPSLQRRARCYPQDDTFLSKARWERASIPSERRPLLLHYHPLTIYRYQILKQADLVLAQMLLGRYFSHAQKNATSTITIP